jgi:hypothetical protein
MRKDRAERSGELASVSAGDQRDRTRPRPIDRALAAFNPSLPREGRIQRQCRRALLVRSAVTMAELCSHWCYPCRPWFYINIKRALRKLGARQIGRANSPGRPAIYATSKIALPLPSRCQNEQVAEILQ